MKKNIINIIKEEVKDFDFLSNRENIENTELINLLKNRDFQKQFICDTLLNNDKIKILNTESSYISGNWDEGDEGGNMNIELYQKLSYIYDKTKNPIIFNLDINGNDVSFHTSTYNEDETNYSESRFTDIDWSDFDVTLSTIDGDNIDFDELYSAPSNIRNLFIRENIEFLISNETSISLDDLNMDNTTHNYC